MKDASLELAVDSSQAPLVCSRHCIFNILGAGAREGELVNVRSFLKPVSFVYLLSLVVFLNLK